MNNINLCMIAPEFFPIWGGTGSYTIELIKFLPKDVNIHVVTLKRKIVGMHSSGPTSNEIESIIGRPIKIHYISTSRETFFYNLPFQIACLRKIPLLIKKHNFDILHTSLSHMPDVFLQLFKGVDIPTVLTIHGTIQMLKKHSLMARRLFGDLEWSEKYILAFYPIIEFLQQKYAKHISRYIAVSNMTKKLAMEHLNIEAERFSVVHNGVDTKVFSPPKKEEMEKKFSKPTVVYMGRIMAKKGITVLIKAMPDVIRRFPQTRFLFVGGGNTQPYVEMIKKIGIPENNFSFVGHVGYYERPKILQDATVFVNPSLFENCSLSILEAMSCNTTVVASNVGGNPEIISSGKNGILTPALDHEKFAKSIISLLEDENLNRKIGEEGRKTVEKSFSSKKCVQETFEIYREILQ